MNTSTQVSGYEQKEGPVARAIESRTSKIPSDVFLWGAGAAILGSLALQVLFQRDRATRFLMRGRRSGPLSIFVGQWAPTLLMLGLYNKIVKVLGSDRVRP